MKSYTDIEQSKKLAEILPLESADMFYAIDAEIVVTTPYITYLNGERNIPAYKGAIPCWSLAALLDILQKTAHSIDEDGSVALDSYKDVDWGLNLINAFDGMVTASNPLDACYEMILKLKEKDLL